MRKVAFIFLGCLATILLAACVGAAAVDPLAGFASPDEYILHEYSESPYANPVILKKQDWGSGLLYILSYQIDVHGQSFEMLGYHLLYRSAGGAGWGRSKGGGFSLGQAEPLSPYANIQVAVGGSSDRPDPTVLYGQVLDPQVQQIRLLTTGETHWFAVENGVFGEVVSRSTHLCALWLLGGNEKILDQVSLAENFAGIPGIANPQECAARETEEAASRSVR